ncbi:DNA repair protein RadC [Peptoniphilus sp. GNH]|nr:DNA repair protein RadC [Clostridiales bacterium KA00134]UHR02895.1 DNA repair protein RadC [Peptoniphilus sp. GNH]
MKKYNIKNLPVEDRPQEKLFLRGVKALSNAELLALIIRTGTKEETSVELCQRLLNVFEEKASGFDIETNDIKMRENSALYKMRNANIGDFDGIMGIGPSKTAMILAAIELGIRMNDLPSFRKIRIDSPEKLYAVLKNEMSSLDVEEFRIAILNTKKDLEKIHTVARGGLDVCHVHPREIFKEAISNQAHTIILIHNHPTGDPSPSKADISLTKRLVEVGEILDIPVIDHIIIGHRSFVSLAREGHI